MHAAELPLEKLAANSSLTDSEKLSELSRHFEAILLRQVLQEGQKTVIRSDLSRDSTARSIYQDQVIHELAEGMSKAGTFGLARSLQRQIGRPLLDQAASASTAAHQPMVAAAPTPASSSGPGAAAAPGLAPAPPASSRHD